MSIAIEYLCPPAVNKPVSQQAIPEAKPLGDLLIHPDNDPGELLRNRYLCRTGGMLLCGPTGIGKSSLIIQMLIQFALGRSLFGIQPVRPLRCLIIQAENDDGDIAEMRDGVIEGLQLTPEDRQTALSNIFVCREDSRFSLEFFLEVVRPLLEKFRPDLLVTDPVLSYLGGDSSSQADVGRFLRNGLNPLLREFNCGGIVVHHTNKPSTGVERGQWKAGDFAYLGGGSAEWANWARAVLAIRSIGCHNVYELMASKRGSRLEWTDAAGERSYSKLIAHSKQQGVIYWREADPDEKPSAGGATPKYTKEMVALLLKGKRLSTVKWQKLAKQEEGMSESTFHRYRRDARTAGQVKQMVGGEWVSLL